MLVETVSPKVKIDRNIRRGKTPYDIILDRESVKMFLASRGVAYNDVRNIRIYVTSKDLEEASNTVYEDRSDIKISVSAGYAWEQYRDAIKAAEGIANGEKASNTPFEDFLYTKRLPRYLQVAPKERGLATARKLLENGVSRELNGSLMHELIHAADILTGKHAFWYKDFGVRISNLLDFARYTIDPSEREAAKFERKKETTPH